MLNMTSILLFSMSSGLFCIGLGYYVDLHLGYDFVPVVIALEIAALFISVGASRSLDKTDLNILSLLAFLAVMASSYLLFTLNYVSMVGYLFAFLFITLPVLLTGSLVMRRGVITSPRSHMLIALAGFCAGVVFGCVIMQGHAIWMIFIFSLVTLVSGIALAQKVSLLTKASVLGLFVCVAYLSSGYSLSDRVAIWTLHDEPLTKSSLYTLYAADKLNVTIEKTVWEKNGRVDTVSTGRSRAEGYSWLIYNANNAVPYVQTVDSTVSWWNDHYPLLILPFELVRPSNVLTVATGRGADVDISQRLYNATTTSIYSDCSAMSDASPCDTTSVGLKLEHALDANNNYDLISFSIPGQVTVPYVGASASHEAIHTMETFHKLYESLDSKGLMAINTSDSTLLYKTLSYVWRQLSGDDNAIIADYRNNIRVLMLNKYALYKDTYNYLVLVSKNGFTPDQLIKIDGYKTTLPVESVIYDAANDEPPYVFFKQMNMITVSAAISHLTSATSWQYKKLVNLEPSSHIKPNFFHLTYVLHPFIATLSALFLFFGLYGLLMSHASMRQGDVAAESYKPSLAVLLFQSCLLTAAYVLFVYAMVTFISASLGSSFFSVVGLMIVCILAYTTPFALSLSSSKASRAIGGAGNYLVIILLCIVMIVGLSIDMQIISDALLPVLYIIAAAAAFFSGKIQSQAIQSVVRLYPGVWFWLWAMAAVGIVIGVIMAKYIMIEYDLAVMLKTSAVMIFIATCIAWWRMIALQTIEKLPINELPKIT